VSYLIQNPKTIWLKVNKCRALSSPPAPQAPVRYTCVQDLSEASLGSLLYRGLHSMPIGSTMQGAAETSPYKLLNLHPTAWAASEVAVYRWGGCRYC
jgi:hypothetical protein